MSDTMQEEGRAAGGIGLSREDQLERIIRNTLWMARRYAHGRQSYSVAQYNEAARTAMRLGVVSDDVPTDEPMYALDGSFSAGMSGLSGDEYASAFRRWSNRKCIPNFCRSDWLSRDSEEGPAPAPPQTHEDIPHV